MHEIAGHRVLRRLGEGGMGAVYLAETPDGQQVAVKVIRPELLARAEFRERFRREVARAQTVPPFCTAEVIQADPDHEPPYLIIEYVDGPSLFQVVTESGPLRGAGLHSLAVGVATALAAIHGAGVVHRDLKPGNVLFSRGSIKVIDFGIARELDSEAPSITTGNQVIGTIPYISPERLGGARTVTTAADVFAWGGVVTFAATGRTPFQGDSPADTAISILSDPPDLEGLDGPLRDLVARALAKDPAQRPTARELLDALLSARTPATASRPKAPELKAREAKALEPEAAEPVLPVEPAAFASTTPEFGTTLGVSPRRRRRKALLTAGASSTVALLVLGAFLSGGWKLFTGAAGTPSTTPAAGQTAATPTLAPTPSATPEPSANPTASPYGTDMIPPGLRLTIEADLKSQGDWRESSHPAGECEIGRNGLTATMNDTAAVFRCEGRFDQMTDFAAYVDVKTTGTSCAIIWFRFQIKGSDGPGVKQPDGGYGLQLCGRKAFFIAHDNNYRTLLEMTLKTSVADKRTRIGVIARGHEFTFLQDGVVVGAADNDTYHIGRVAFGLFQRNGDPPSSYTATFSDLVVFGTSLSNPVTR